MQGDLLFSISLLTGFLLVLIRLSGIFVFIPIPGAHAGSPTTRIILTLVCTFALFPIWPVIDVVPTISQLVVWIAAEAAIGLTAGVLFSYIAEAFVLGAQVLSLQAGYGYASTIDPATNADSGILLIFAQLVAGMLFFATGLDRYVIAAIAASLEAYPPGEFVVSKPLAAQLISAGSAVFTLACRIALPIVGLLFMIDIALGVLGRINAQVQAGSLAFPLKMLLTLAMLAMMASIFPTVYEAHAARLMGVLRSAVAPR